jgi:hypothetical protein
MKVKHPTIERDIERWLNEGGRDVEQTERESMVDSRQRKRARDRAEPVRENAV